MKATSSWQQIRSGNDTSTCAGSKDHSEYEASVGFKDILPTLGGLKEPDWSQLKEDAGVTQDCMNPQQEALSRHCSEQLGLHVQVTPADVEFIRKHTSGYICIGMEGSTLDRLQVCTELAHHGRLEVQKWLVRAHAHGSLGLPG